MNTWPSFYKNRVTNEYFTHIQKKYQKFINYIHNEANKPDQIIVELGCGISSVTKALAQAQKHKCVFIALDKDPEMLKLSAENLATSGLSKINIEQGDITIDSEVPEGTVGHSHGVLEHFSDSDIKKIINIQKRKFQTLVHYVPSRKYKTPSFGDERLMMPGEWYNICQPDKIIPFNQGYDLMLIWRKKYPMMVI